MKAQLHVITHQPFDDRSHNRVKGLQRAASPQPKLLQPVFNAGMKAGGGFWTSTFTGSHYGSAFVQYQMAAWRQCLNRCFLLQPDPNANVYVVDSPADIEKLWDFGAFSPLPESVRHLWQDAETEGNVTGGYASRHWMMYPDFEQMSKHYDAIHLTAQGLHYASEYGSPLYGWDCESTFWFRWRFVRVHDLGWRRFVPDVPPGRRFIEQLIQRMQAGEITEGDVQQLFTERFGR